MSGHSNESFPSGILAATETKLGDTECLLMLGSQAFLAMTGWFFVLCGFKLNLVFSALNLLPPSQLGIAKISLAAESLASGNIKGNRKHRLRRVADEKRKE